MPNHQSQSSKSWEPRQNFSDGFRRKSNLPRTSSSPRRWVLLPLYNCMNHGCRKKSFPWLAMMPLKMSFALSREIILDFALIMKSADQISSKMAVFELNIYIRAPYTGLMLFLHRQFFIHSFIHYFINSFIQLLIYSFFHFHFSFDFLDILFLLFYWLWTCRRTSRLCHRRPWPLPRRHRACR